MVNKNELYNVIIIGGGPVGLFLAICLIDEGLSCVVLEKRKEPVDHSRSLGVHPVSLELFDKLGFSEQFLDYGVRISNGIAFSSRGKIGKIPFSYNRGKFPFILSIPQYRTEEILLEQLINRDPDCLIRGAEVTGIEKADSSNIITYTKGTSTTRLKGSFLAGCDGKDSFVRETSGFRFLGDSYPDTYMMGDFTDNTIFESDAAVFLSSDGLVESFPLPDDYRRWVVKTDTYNENPSRKNLEKRVAERVGHDLGEEKMKMISSFGVQKYIADPIARGQIALAGDAAHVLSPIGGQGMNLGWLDAWDLKNVFKEIIVNERNSDNQLENYSKRRQKIAEKAIRRSEFNMKLGRKTRVPFLKHVFLWLLLNTPLRHFMARFFTMRGLKRWPV